MKLKIVLKWIAVPFIALLNGFIGMIGTMMFFGYGERIIFSGDYPIAANILRGLSVLVGVFCFIFFGIRAAPRRVLASVILSSLILLLVVYNIIGLINEVAERLTVIIFIIPSVIAIVVNLRWYRFPLLIKIAKRRRKQG